MSAAGEGFLGRWSRRKAGLEDAADPAAAAALPVADPVAEPLARSPVSEVAAEPVPPTSTALSLPTMDDVSALTRSSDYSRFVGRGVEPGVRNAAMKKLFSDPHFNIMDGLDTYIDDYGKPDPIPPAMLRLMNQSASLRLFDDDTVPAAGGGPDPAQASAPAQACPDGDAPVAMAQSDPTPSTVPPPAPASIPDDDADLRLQPDDAPGRCGPEPGPGA